MPNVTRAAIDADKRVCEPPVALRRRCALKQNAFKRKLLPCICHALLISIGRLCSDYTNRPQFDSEPRHLFDLRVIHMRLDAFGKNQRRNTHPRLTAVMQGVQKVTAAFTPKWLVVALLCVCCHVSNTMENSLNQFVRSYHCYIVVSFVVIIHNCSVQ